MLVDLTGEPGCHVTVRVLPAGTHRALPGALVHLPEKTAAVANGLCRSSSPPGLVVVLDAVEHGVPPVTSEVFAEVGS
jgi:hypothetical protein